MKKSLLVMLSLMVICILAACGSKVQDKGDVSGVNGTDIVVDDEEQEDPLADLDENTPLTLDDLYNIERYRFPKSYTYTVLDKNGTITGTGEYIYPELLDDDESFPLLPIYEKTVKMEVINSVMDHDRINTTANITLENGEIYTIVYINNPSTLEYAGASLYKPTETILYTFDY